MKVKPVIIVFCFNCLICVSSNINPGCECVVYESAGTYPPTQGTFTSPNYPRIYPTNINCILYTFMGGLDEIVELTFLEFDMQVPITNKCSDYLRLFLDLERSEVNDKSVHNYDLCGNISMITKKHYSSTRVLIFEFHTDSLQQNNQGFLGRFKFLNKTMYEIQGCVVRWGQPCVYDCRSDYDNRSNNDGNGGIIFSPGYPQNYPPNQKCRYIFNAGHNERVKVSFQKIQLDPIDGSCDKSPDSIIVRDGMETSAPVISRYCNDMSREQVISSGKDLIVEFKSDGNKERQGFAANFEFIDERAAQYHTTTYRNYRPPPVDSTTTSTQATSVVQGCSSQDCDCIQYITSDTHKNGTITSPNFPNVYPTDCEKTIRFVGRESERVQVEFESLNLYYSDDIDCNKQDRLQIRTLLKSGTWSEIYQDHFCGPEVPQLLMSSGNQLEVVLTTLSRNGATDSTQHSVGFKAKYRFVTDFGITSGHQNKYNGECVFEFHSFVSSNGTFMSPNSPGFYPRETECQYLFYGKKSEKVFIEFAYFDVDGMTPECAEESRSDYIEFSNFAVGLEDEKMSPLCGQKKDMNLRPVLSDKNFFRVRFISNDLYDATGFEAYFQFRKDRDPFEAGSTGSLNSSSHPTRACPSLLIAVMLLTMSVC